MDTADTPLNILVVEDNDNLRDSIVDALGSLGHHVRGVDCGEAVGEQLDLMRLDIAVLDLNLPGEDGLSLAARLHNVHPKLGIVMLTARVQAEDRAAGYAQGADIYLCKPASLAELQQAIGALTRRLRSTYAALPVDNTCLDLLRLTVTCSDGRVFSLTNHEAALLAAFARSSQNILETWQIAEILGMDVDHINKPAVELHIVRLRKKLPVPAGAGSPILAVRGRGYQLCVPMQLV